MKNDQRERALSAWKPDSVIFSGERGDLYMSYYKALGALDPDGDEPRAIEYVKCCMVANAFIRKMINNV